MKETMRRFATKLSEFSRGLRILAVLASMLLCGSAIAQQLTFYSADAYGASAYVGNSVSVAPTAEATFGGYCGVYQVGVQKNGTAAGVSLPPLITTGVTITSAADNDPYHSTAKSEVHSINLLNGLITSDIAKSASTTTFNPPQITYSAAGSSFANLKVLGLPILFTPAPNTSIGLPGIGKIVLNEQVVNTINPGNTHFSVNMLHLYVTLPNLLNIPLGTEVILSSATSGIQVIPGVAAVDGIAYGSTVISSLVQSNPTAKIILPCRGTNNVVNTNSLAGINVQNVLNTGTITNTVVGDVRGLPASSETTSTIQAAALLGGLVKASVIQAQADGSTTDSVNLHFSTSGRFVGLSVSGHPEINDNVADNTTVPLLGLGTLYIRRIIPDVDNIEMRMLELVINQRNVFGLPIGTDIIIGSAEASLHPGPPR